MISKLLEKIYVSLAGRVENYRETRRTVRFARRLTVECVHRGTHFKALLLDLGSGGLRIETVRKLKRGAVVLVRRRMKEDWSHVTGRVQWSRPNRHGNYVAGLRFVDDVETCRAWVGDILEEVGLAECEGQFREFYRVDASVSAVLSTLEGDILMTGDLRGLSMGGATVRGPAAIVAGLTVVVHIGPASALPVLQMKAMVLATRHNVSSEETLYRVQFVEVSEGQERVLRLYMRHFVMDAMLPIFPRP